MPPGIGLFIKSEWQGPTGHIFEMQHRYEDRALIIEVIRDWRPARAIELGTAKGGFAALLADTVGGWATETPAVVTLDLTPERGVKQALEAAYPGALALQDDVLVPLPEPGVWPFWKSLLRKPGTLLYCDNGNKEREIELYAPILGPHALLGTHDYLTEVDPAWVEPYLASLGYVPHRHRDFEALADPEYYPASLTRFWIREQPPAASGGEPLEIVG